MPQTWVGPTDIIDDIILPLSICGVGEIQSLWFWPTNDLLKRPYVLRRINVHSSRNTTNNLCKAFSRLGGYQNEVVCQLMEGRTLSSTGKVIKGISHPIKLDMPRKCKGDPKCGKARRENDISRHTLDVLISHIMIYSARALRTSAHFFTL